MPGRPPATPTKGQASHGPSASLSTRGSQRSLLPAAGRPIRPPRPHVASAASVASWRSCPPLAPAPTVDGHLEWLLAHELPAWFGRLVLARLSAPCARR